MSPVRRLQHELSANEYRFPPHASEGAAMKYSPPTRTISGKSVWSATTKMPRGRPLSGDVEADVCIVGAGIAGLTTGYLLTQAGKSVVILDDGAIGQRHDASHDRPPFQRHRRSLHRTSSAGTASAARSWPPKATRRRSIASRRSPNELDIDCDFDAAQTVTCFWPRRSTRRLLDQELAAAPGAPGCRPKWCPARPCHSTPGRRFAFPIRAAFIR